MAEHKKFTDEFIIKAFEHLIDCTSRDNLISNDGVTKGDLLDLITRQKAEIGRLKNENDILSKNADTAFQDELDEEQGLYAEQVKDEIKSEAVKEFAERLKEEWFNNRYDSPDIDFDYFIDLNVEKI